MAINNNSKILTIKFLKFLDMSMLRKKIIFNYIQKIKKLKIKQNKKKLIIKV